MNLSLLLSEPVNMPAPLGFDSWLTFWLVIVVSVVNAGMLCLAGYKFLQVFQLSNYRLKGYFGWIKEDRGAYWGRLLILTFLSSAALLITNVLLENFFVYKIMTYLGLVFYFIFVTVFVINQFNVTKKTPLKYTHRMNRLIAVLFVLIFFATVFMLNFTSIYIPYFKYGAVGFTPVLLPIFILLAYFITWPYEHLKNKRYVKIAKEKLEGEKNLIRIGITGSYGKTSVKNILATMLSEKFEVCSTPYSYNTPLGIAKTVSENLKPNHQIFIAEMGARYVGDIKELCDIVKPNYGILTGIGNQHLASFKTQQNLENTKFELVLGLEKDGEMFFNGDCLQMKSLIDKATCTKFVSSISATDGEVYVTDLISTSKGSEFVLHYKGDKISCQTVLLGKHNVSNILLCAMVALRLGLSLEEIARAIEKLTPVSHRLALLPSANSLIVIDDAYNGSVDGAKAALEVLSEFEGKKFVITPGLVELGSEQFNCNFEFGMMLAKTCDYVIINGIVNYDAISSGLEFAGFSKDKILRAGSLSQAVQVLTNFAVAGDVVLFENDLPDNYT